ncbi:zinc ribbon domain-containing protein [Caballeronia sp. 15711]|uniref:zinc ribbon domain-containing protein n=1 Tax=Caballeronia sp. 15711 TaxID=3391029 RepID=UPI0039E5A2EB
MDRDFGSRVDQDTFALAQERLESSKKHASRRTIEPSILQGLAHGRECGYALYRASTRSSSRKISYYRCLGTVACRYDGHAKCEHRPIRLDLLERLVAHRVPEGLAFSERVAAVHVCDATT